jgi:hypothetical protein
MPAAMVFTGASLVPLAWSPPSGETKTDEAVASGSGIGPTASSNSIGYGTVSSFGRLLAAWCRWWW